MKSRNIYNNRLVKLKKTCRNEMQNENYHFLNIEAKAATGEEEKLQSKTKN